MLIKLADQGYEKTLKENKNYLAGLNVFKGQITYKGVADAFNLKYTPPENLIQKNMKFSLEITMKTDLIHSP